MEKCENCGVLIGNLETPFIRQGRVVCAACNTKLGHVPLSGGVRTIQATPTSGNSNGGNPRTRKGITWPARRHLVVGAIIFVVLGACSGWVFHREILEADADADPKFSVDRSEAGEAGFSTAYWEVVNNDTSQLVIYSFEYNGDAEGPIAGLNIGRWVVLDPSRSTPVSLSVGEPLLFLESSNVGMDTIEGSYHKVVVFVDISTNRGDFRFTPGKGFARISVGADHWHRHDTAGADKAAADRVLQERQSINDGMMGKDYLQQHQ